jgi:Prokaryotic membrane lipoprotein lipid attachment site
LKLLQRATESIFSESVRVKQTAPVTPCFAVDDIKLAVSAPNLFAGLRAPSPRWLAETHDPDHIWRMQRAILAITLVVTLTGCSQESTPEAIEACKVRTIAGYNPKDMNQCVRACIACENGVVTTCTTSCTLKGARGEYTR